jgi:hypothetical protein
MQRRCVCHRCLLAVVLILVKHHRVTWKKKHGSLVGRLVVELPLHGLHTALRWMNSVASMASSFSPDLPDSVLE